MGIFNGLMGNASEINLDALIKEYNKILAENERIENCIINKYGVDVVKKGNNIKAENENVYFYK